MSRVLAVDLGKTRCRVGTMVGSTWQLAESAGSPGLADAADVEDAVASILAASRKLSDAPEWDAVYVGAAGAIGAPGAARRLGERLSTTLRSRHVLVTSDVVAAHAGAFAGGAGTLLAVGTGAVVLAVDEHGIATIVDGLGPWIGDVGGGAWIGRAGLRAALMWSQGVGGSGPLAEAARQRFGSLTQIPSALNGTLHPAEMLARFAPDVLACAGMGDELAASIIADACRALAASVTAAVASNHVALWGGLAAALAPIIERSLDVPLAGPLPVTAALDGAVRLASGPSTALERFVIRVVGDEVESLQSLVTEQAQPGLDDLDCRSAADITALVLQTEMRAQKALARALPQLATAAEAVADRLLHGGRLFYLGAGTSGRLAMLDAAELAPTYSLPPGRVIPLLAGGPGGMLQAVEGAEDDRNAAEAALRAHALTKEDAVVGIAASGRTPYVLEGLRYAAACGALSVAVVNNAGSACASVADLAIEVLTGPELVAGSTRMSAGTTQKIVLNALSTAAMVALGKTYGPLMVDVAVTNDKLRKRAVGIIRRITGRSAEEAGVALAASGGAVKPAIVSLVADISPAAAMERLAEARGMLRQVLLEVQR